MLQYVCNQVDGEKNLSKIVKSINILLAVEWGRQAGNDAYQSNIMKCCQSTGLYLGDEVIKDKGEELANLKMFLVMMIPRSALA